MGRTKGKIDVVCAEVVNAKTQVTVVHTSIHSAASPPSRVIHYFTEFTTRALRRELCIDTHAVKMCSRRVREEVAAREATRARSG